MNWETKEQWERAYDDAVQWRDWQTCEILLDEREHAEWWKRQKKLRKLMKERLDRIGW